MRLEKHNADEMTPLERIYAYEHGLSYDRIPSVPFIGNVRCKVGGMTPEEYWDSAENMVKAEPVSYTHLDVYKRQLLFYVHLHTFMY